MSFRISKSVSLGKGIRLDLSKTGVGVSAGVPGLRYSVHSSGRTVRTVGLPGSGIYYRKDSSGRTRAAPARSAATRAPAPAVRMYPKAGLLAPKEEKPFVKGVTAYMQGEPERALQHFRNVMSRDAAHAHVGEEYFAAMALIALGRHDEAIEPLEQVVASPEELPNGLMRKYGVTGEMTIQVTPTVMARLPISHVGAALMLAELYQRTGKRTKAIELLESLGSLAPDPIFALSLAELYAEEAEWHEVIRVTEGFENRDDPTCELLALRARALYELGIMDGCVAAAKEAVRSRKRNPELLRLARYLRALAYEASGKKALARKDLEHIYSEDSTFADVAERLGLKWTEDRRWARVGDHAEGAARLEAALCTRSSVPEPRDRELYPPDRGPWTDAGTLPTNRGRRPSSDVQLMLAPGGQGCLAARSARAAELRGGETQISHADLALGLEDRNPPRS